MQTGAIALLVMIAIGVIGVGLLFAASPGQSESKNLDLGVGEAGGEVQIVEITATSRGYEPREIRVKAGVPVELRLSADRTAGCSRSFVMKDFGIKTVVETKKTQTFRFTPPAGEFTYRCSMNMYRGKLVAQ